MWYLITTGLKQTRFNVISYPLRYKYVNQTAPKNNRRVDVRPANKKSININVYRTVKVFLFGCTRMDGRGHHILHNVKDESHTRIS
jgi:hypothetical protein